MKSTPLTALASIALVTLSLSVTPVASAGALWQAAKQASLNKGKAAATRPVMQRQLHPEGKPHTVVIQRSKAPHSAAHIEHAQKQGQPSVLHIDRANAHQRRTEAIGPINASRRPGPRYDRDEYPPAFTREGGANANVRYIPSSDNRSAGASMGAQIRHLPDGSKIQIVVAN